METRDRHLKLLTDTIEAVNSTLDLEEVLAQVASSLADALESDACFVYLYDERANELVLRATHGTPIDSMSRRPRMRPGEGITGSAAEARAPVMLESQAHLDPRFKNFPNLPEDEYESILAVPILTRDGTLEGALNLRTGARARSRTTRSSCCWRSRRSARSRLSTRSSTPRPAARARAGGARANLGGGVGVALPRGVARGDRQDDDGRDARDRRRARSG
jgi:Signal transduction protein containing GAF and PtsI domains